MKTRVTAAGGVINQPQFLFAQDEEEEKISSQEQLQIFR
jgi:hypothetical protein